MTMQPNSARYLSPQSIDAPVGVGRRLHEQNPGPKPKANHQSN